MITAWEAVAIAIDRAYNGFSGTKPFHDMRSYNFCGKWLPDMTYQECVTALAKFKVPCDNLDPTREFSLYE